MTNFFAFLTAKNTANEENLQAPLFEELSDSETSIIRGGGGFISVRMFLNFP